MARASTLCARASAASAIRTAGLSFAIASTACSSFNSGQSFSKSPATVASGKSGCPITAASDRHSSRSVFSCIRADHAHALRFHFRFQHFGFIGLAGIHQAPLRLRGILRDLRQVAARIEQLLRRQYAQKRHLHRALHADFLFLRLELRELHVFSEYLAAQSQLSAGHDRLLHKKSLLSAAYRAAANFIARVANRRIRIEPRLLPPCLRRANLCLRLPQRRIRLAGDLLYLLQRDQRALRMLLRSSPSADIPLSSNSYLRASRAACLGICISCARTAPATATHCQQ